MPEGQSAFDLVILHVYILPTHEVLHAMGNQKRQRLVEVSRTLPVVGIGASAGGLEAISLLLRQLPNDTGMAFIFVQHLDPQYESELTRILGRATTMPTTQVTNNLRIEPNHVYVIPPNVVMTMTRGVLKLRPRSRIIPAHGAIDLFFESLAKDRKDRAIGVLLSGTATDGTQGLEAIKAEGGITIAQDDTAKYDSMPRSAINAGCVDFVLSPEKIAKELDLIARHPYVRGEGLRSDLDRSLAEAYPEDAEIRAEEIRSSSSHHWKATARVKSAENGLKKILTLLRNHSAVDFTLYKPSTIHRRIMRRMVLNRLASLDEYAAMLHRNPKELSALYSDVLINVTGFFRNPDAYEVLKKKVFPKIVTGRRFDPVRIWIAGCSTGQEAYSIAMIYSEFIEKIPRAPRLQVFATDLNEDLLDRARQGLYSKSLVTDISPERLRRFFTEEDGGFRVNKYLRAQVVFARQNIINDPPFSRIDLISCRNLLIYFDQELQKKALLVFHYALNPKGFLFLGSSESTGTYNNLFDTVDKKAKLFSKRPIPTPMLRFPLKPAPEVVKQSSQAERAKESNAGSHPESDALREADRITIGRFAPPSVVIDSNLDIIQFRGATSRYLLPSSGKASFNILKMAREGLTLPLHKAINEAKKDKKPVVREGISIKHGAETIGLTIEVLPLRNVKQETYLVLFDETVPLSRKRPGVPVDVESNRLRKRKPGKKEEPATVASRLKQELAETRDYLQAVQEQYEAANEELQASSEEVQSANEELQSINEEVETSKEELESSNEELTTVNEELTNRNNELSQLTADLNNFLAAVNLPILLLGRDFTIRRFTPPAEQLFNLLASDIGRYIGGIKHNLKLPELEQILEDVIKTVSMRELEVQDNEGKWYTLRARPYMTADHRIDGVVLLLVDIDALKRSEIDIKRARDNAEAVLRTAPVPLLVLRADLQVAMASEAFYALFKVTPELTENRLIFDLGWGEWNIPKLRTLLEDILPHNKSFNNFEVTNEFKAIGRRTILLNARRLEFETGQPRRILLVLEDITERLEVQAAIRLSELRYRRLFESAKDGIILLDPTTTAITDANPNVAELIGIKRDELLGKYLWQIGLLRDESDNQQFFQRLASNEYVRYDDIEIQTATGEPLTVEIIANLYKEDGHTVVQCNIRNVTERKQNERALQEAHSRLNDQATELEKLVIRRTSDLQTSTNQLETFVYTIAHDLRSPLRAMQGFAQILRDDFGGQLGENGIGYTYKISEAAQTLDALLRDLLDYSRISQGQIHLHPIELESAIMMAIRQSREQISQTSAEVNVVQPLPAVIAHKPSLVQAIMNLISNAVKFVAPETRPRVTIRAEEQDSNVRIWVEDNGIGVSPEQQARIFRIFERGEPRKYPGTGIGLAIVRKSVERMGGETGVDSEPGMGSRFWIQLKRAETHSAEPKGEA
jgi:two-component system CheB/CheR fusion protein